MRSYAPLGWRQSIENHLKFSEHEICLFFIYLFTDHLFTSVWTHRYLFLHLGYNLMLLYFVAQIVQLWPLGALVLVIVQSCDLWHTLINVRFVLRFWGNNSLLSDTTKYSSLILYISCPSPRIRYSPNKQRISIFKSIWSIIVNMPSRNHSVLIYNHYSNRYENVHLPHTLVNVEQCLWGWDGVCFFSLQ